MCISDGNAKVNAAWVNETCEGLRSALTTPSELATTVSRRRQKRATSIKCLVTKTSFSSGLPRPTAAADDDRVPDSPRFGAIDCARRKCGERAVPVSVHAERRALRRRDLHADAGGCTGVERSRL